VTKVVERGQEELIVELEASHARHRLKRNATYFAELLATLQEAVDKRTPLVVSETDTHEIIDARPWPHGPSGQGDRGGLSPEPERGFLARIWWWLRRLFWRWCCVSPHRAQELFDLLSARTCDPLTVPPPCIPFLYPDDGCWARAHEMCRLLLAEGVWPRKVWIDGNLHTAHQKQPSLLRGLGLARGADYLRPPSLLARRADGDRSVPVRDPGHAGSMERGPG
jgi:hypothetical protein